MPWGVENAVKEWAALDGVGCGSSITRENARDALRGGYKIDVNLVNGNAQLIAVSYARLPNVRCWWQGSRVVAVSAKYGALTQQRPSLHCTALAETQHTLSTLPPLIIGLIYSLLRRLSRLCKIHTLFALHIYEVTYLAPSPPQSLDVTKMSRTDVHHLHGQSKVVEMDGGQHELQ
jgi:hypothetical protein